MAARAGAAALAINLGDTVDRKAGGNVDLASHVVFALSRSRCDVIHLIGNHDLSSISREQLKRVFKWTQFVAKSEVPIAPEEAGTAAYCCYSLGKDWSIISLDTYDLALSAFAYPKGHAKLVEAQAMYDEGNRKHLPHYSIHPEQNGGVGAAQLRWLGQALAQLRAAGKRAVVVSHAPLSPRVTKYEDALCWNWPHVCAVVAKYRDVVTLCVAGHDHFGAHAVDDAGLHHVVLQATVEGPNGQAAHATMYLPQPFGPIKIVGEGIVSSYTI
eukprot:TRINITY_DN3485_c0_g2_i1.p1 TRINITY_DN3485_c0_g2~~TRINITY_DN3485_c0_g2_i1.p1  ORF type:complete len:271 (-),score=75.61 TRINITY_DN3485_c0_g2_i1:43-855(-)